MPRPTTRHTLFACFALLAVALPARADEVGLKDVYWQRVAGAGWVDFDPDFNAVLHTETGYYFPRTGKLVKYRDGKPAPAAFDRAGRAWVRDSAKGAGHLWSGETWEAILDDPRRVFEDASGRVFLFDGTHVRGYGKDGKWTGPTEIRKFLATEHVALRKAFPTASGGMEFFNLVNDGANLWAVFDAKVLCVTKDGTVIEAEWPREKPNAPLPYAMLSLTGDGKVILSGPVGDGHVLALADGKIKATDFMMPGNNPAANTNETTARWKLAKDGTLWYWVATSHGNLKCALWHYRDGKWTEKKGIGVPVHEDADGAVWCLPEPRTFGKLWRVTGTASEEFTFAEETLGFTAVPKGVSVWAVEDRVYCLDTGAKGAKPLLRWRLLSEKVFGVQPAVVDEKGAVLLGTVRGKFDAPKP